MKLYLNSVFRFSVLSFCCSLITVRETDSTYIPGRCLCPVARNMVRGVLKDLTVIPTNPSCHKVTVILEMKNGQKVCVNPDAPLGRHLVHCWKRSTKMNRNVRNCLRRKRRIGLQNQPRQQRKRGQNRGPRSSPTPS